MASRLTSSRSKITRRGLTRTTAVASAKRSAASGSETSRDKVQAYRERMRAKGFRLMQMWLPDTQSPEFAKEAHRQSLRAARSPTEREDQAFMDSIADRD
jgi:hypothetical protein